MTCLPRLSLDCSAALSTTLRCRRHGRIDGIAEPRDNSIGIVAVDDKENAAHGSWTCLRLCTDAGEGRIRWRGYAWS
jgi:hypothetical protein